MKNNKGSVLVFFLLLAIPMILLLLMSFSLTRLMAARDEGRSAVRIAIDGVMSEYDKSLYQEFGLLGVKKEKYDVGMYLFQQNLNPTDAGGTTVSPTFMNGNITISGLEDKNLGDSDLLFQQIKEFEKYMNLEDAEEMDVFDGVNQSLHENLSYTEALLKIKKRVKNLEIPDSVEQFVEGYSISAISLTDEQGEEELFKEIKNAETDSEESVLFSNRDLNGSEMLQKMVDELIALSTELLLPESEGTFDPEKQRMITSYVQKVFNSEQTKQSDDELRNQYEQEYILYGNEKSGDNRMELAQQIFEWRFMWEICLFEFSEEDETSINKESLEIEKKVSEAEIETENTIDHDDSVKLAAKYYRDLYVIEKACRKAYEDTVQLMTNDKPILDKRLSTAYEMTKQDYINLFFSFKIRTEEDLICRRIRAVIDGYIQKKDGSGTSLKDYYSAVEGTADITISVPGLPSQNMTTTWYEEY